MPRTVSTKRKGKRKSKATYARTAFVDEFTPDYAESNFSVPVVAKDSVPADVATAGEPTSRLFVTPAKAAPEPVYADCAPPKVDLAQEALSADTKESRAVRCPPTEEEQMALMREGLDKQTFIAYGGDPWHLEDRMKLFPLSIADNCTTEDVMAGEDIYAVDPVYEVEAVDTRMVDDIAYPGNMIKIDAFSTVARKVPGSRLADFAPTQGRVNAGNTMTFSTPDPDSFPPALPDKFEFGITNGPYGDPGPRHPSDKTLRELGMLPADVPATRDLPEHCGPVRFSSPIRTGPVRILTVRHPCKTRCMAMKPDVMVVVSIAMQIATRTGADVYVEECMRPIRRAGKKIPPPRAFPWQFKYPMTPDVRALFMQFITAISGDYINFVIATDPQHKWAATIHDLEAKAHNAKEETKARASRSMRKGATGYAPQKVLLWSELDPDTQWTKAEGYLDKLIENYLAYKHITNISTAKIVSEAPVQGDPCKVSVDRAGGLTRYKRAESLSTFYTAANIGATVRAMGRELFGSDEGIGLADIIYAPRKRRDFAPAVLKDTHEVQMSRGAHRMRQRGTLVFFNRDVVRRINPGLAFVTLFPSECAVMARQADIRNRARPAAHRCVPFENMDRVEPSIVKPDGSSIKTFAPWKEHEAKIEALSASDVPVYRMLADTISEISTQPRAAPPIIRELVSETPKLAPGTVLYTQERRMNSYSEAFVLGALLTGERIPETFVSVGFEFLHILNMLASAPALYNQQKYNPIFFGRKSSGKTIVVAFAAKNHIVTVSCPTRLSKLALFRRAEEWRVPIVMTDTALEMVMMLIYVFKTIFHDDTAEVRTQWVEGGAYSGAAGQLCAAGAPLACATNDHTICEEAAASRCIAVHVPNVGQNNRAVIKSAEAAGAMTAHDELARLTATMRAAMFVHTCIGPNENLFESTVASYFIKLICDFMNNDDARIERGMLFQVLSAALRAGATMFIHPKHPRSIARDVRAARAEARGRSLPRDDPWYTIDPTDVDTAAEILACSPLTPEAAATAVGVTGATLEMSLPTAVRRAAAAVALEARPFARHVTSDKTRSSDDWTKTKLRLHRISVFPNILDLLEEAFSATMGEHGLVIPFDLLVKMEKTIDPQAYPDIRNSCAPITIDTTKTCTPRVYTPASFTREGATIEEVVVSAWFCARSKNFPPYFTAATMFSVMRAWYFACDAAARAKPSDRVVPPPREYVDRIIEALNVCLDHATSREGQNLREKQARWWEVVCITLFEESKELRKKRLIEMAARGVMGDHPGLRSGILVRQLDLRMSLAKFLARVREKLEPVFHINEHAIAAVLARPVQGYELVGSPATLNFESIFDQMHAPKGTEKCLSFSLHEPQTFYDAREGTARGAEYIGAALVRQPTMRINGGTGSSSMWETFNWRVRPTAHRRSPVISGTGNVWTGYQGAVYVAPEGDMISLDVSAIFPHVLDGDGLRLLAAFMGGGKGARPVGPIAFPVRDIRSTCAALVVDELPDAARPNIRSPIFRSPREAAIALHHKAMAEGGISVGPIVDSDGTIVPPRADIGGNDNGTADPRHTFEEARLAAGEVRKEILKKHPSERTAKETALLVRKVLYKRGDALDAVFWDPNACPSISTLLPSKADGKWPEAREAQLAREMAGMQANGTSAEMLYNTVMGVGDEPPPKHTPRSELLRKRREARKRRDGADSGTEPPKKLQEQSSDVLREKISTLAAELKNRGEHTVLPSGADPLGLILTASEGTPEATRKRPPDTDPSTRPAKRCRTTDAARKRPRDTEPEPRPAKRARTDDGAMPARARTPPGRPPTPEPMDMETNDEMA